MSVSLNQSKQKVTVFVLPFARKGINRSEQRVAVMLQTIWDSSAFPTGSQKDDEAGRTRVIK